MISEEKAKRKKKSKRFFTKKKLIIIGIFLLLVIAELIRSNSYIDVDEFSVSSDKLPASFDGAVIVQISDYHNHGGKAYDKRLLKAIEKQNPDYIFLTGDIADALLTDIDKSNSFLEQVSKISDCYLVWGNHDYNIGDEAREQIYQCAVQNGITVLENEMTTLERDGEQISLVGTVSEMDSNYCDELWEEYANTDQFTLWLHHYPEDFKSIAEKSKELGNSADVIFTGHAHGGLFRFPFLLDGLYAPGQEFFPEYTSGEYEYEGSVMLVSRGVGNSGRTRRLLNPFHLVVCTLEAE